MSPSSSALASTRIAWVSGSGSLAGGAEATRLLEKLSATACSTAGLPSAVKRVFFAMTCTWPCTWWK